MAQEYKVTKVSQEAPREYQGQHGTIYYIKVLLEGHNKPVSIGKKTQNALKIGDTVYGTVTETQYDADKFTSEQNPNMGSGASKFSKTDPLTMYVSYAKDLFVAMYEKDGIKIDTKKFEEYVDIVATTGKRMQLKATEAKPTLAQQWHDTKEEKKVRQTSTDTPPLEAYEDNMSDDETINFDDIPFN